MNLGFKILCRKTKFQQVILGKVIAGSSAGAYVLSRFFYTSSHEIQEGPGILPIAIRCHYQGEPRIVAELKPYTDKYGLEMVLLKDCEYKVIEQ